MPAKAPEDGYVLIVTYGRSGSTLLQNVLLSVDGYSIRGENNNVLMPLFKAYQRAANTKQVYGKNVKTQDRPWYGADKVRPERFAKRLVNSFIDEILVPDEGARVIGFKEIRYHEVGEKTFPQFMDFILKFFAPCRIIFNMRNASDVAQSAWFKSRDRNEVMAEIASYDGWYRDYAAKHPDNCLLIDYDSYKDNVQGLKPLFDFLGEPFDAGRLQQILDVDLNHCKPEDNPKR